MNTSDHEVRVAQLEELPEGKFEVAVISPDGSQSKHTVTLSEQGHHQLTNGMASPETLLEQSFYFLLEREPKESILPSFDLLIIGKYFPEYEGTMRRILSADNA
jgi:hypothetical protein